MYEILRHPAGWQKQGGARHPDLVVHMRQNRSHLPQEARVALTVLTTLFLFTSIAPAFRGQLLVPIYSLVVMGALLVALEWHERSVQYAETLQLGASEARYSDNKGRSALFPVRWLQLQQKSANPSDLRLVLVDRLNRLEFGNSLSLDERRALATIIQAVLPTEVRR